MVLVKFRRLAPSGDRLPHLGDSPLVDPFQLIGPVAELLDEIRLCAPHQGIEQETESVLGGGIENGPEEILLERVPGVPVVEHHEGAEVGKFESLLKDEIRLRSGVGQERVLFEQSLDVRTHAEVCFLSR